MVYMIEKFNLKTATPYKLDNFIKFARSELMPFYADSKAMMKIAWVDNGESLFQVGHLIEFPDIGACLRFYMFAKENEKLQKKLDHHMPQRTCQAYQSGSPVFVDVLNQAILDCQAAPIKACTIATLKMAPGQMESFIPKQEGAARIGMPLIAFLNPITGNQNVVIDIWKGDLQEAGYQKKQFYEAIGMPEEYWEWIRQIAPHEKMSRVHLLPYSPLQ